MITIEEKAKAYDEALEVMRQWIAPCHNKSQLDTLKKSVFPELAESEDERIRKDIVAHYKLMKEKALLDNQEGTTEIVSACDDAISWLENQKQSFRQIHDSIMWDSGLRTGIELGKQKEQKGEQKPINWTELTWKDAYNEDKKNNEKDIRQFLHNLITDIVWGKNWFVSQDECLNYIDNK